MTALHFPLYMYKWTDLCPPEITAQTATKRDRQGRDPHTEAWVASYIAS